MTIDPMGIVALILVVWCLLGLSWFAGSDAPYIPTRMEVIKKVLIAAGVKKGKKFYELGSGDGRVVYEAAKMGAESIGIEQSILRVWYSKYIAKKLELNNAHFLHGDIFKKNYKDADIIFIYLLQPAIDQLEKKLKSEVKKGGVLMTQTYHFKNTKPTKTLGSFQLYKL